MGEVFRKIGIPYEALKKHEILSRYENYKLSLLKEDGTSTFILMETNQLIFGEQKIETTNGLLTLIKENGTTSNITLQPA